ncbi:MAG TPA: aminoglycoside phosphotransferase family protein [Gemmatimonadales bacterium]|nr:aminoglycoside phosphotransferase family protein [Gemmatimonadales bacterium]
MTTDREAREALTAFALPPSAAECVRVPGGHINATWRAGPWLLQRINPLVFPDGAAVMENVLAVTRRLAERPGSAATHLQLRRTRDGRWWHVAEDGAVWRVFAYIEGRTFDTAASPDLAEGAARAFGEFASSMGEPPLHLHTTLPGFHDTRRRVDALADTATRDPAGRARDVRRELDTILGERALAAIIPDFLATGDLPLRVAHNDAKIANVVFAPGSGAPLAVIDLDTTMPGSPLHDFGDLVRSMVSEAAEDAFDPASVRVRHVFFEAIVRGYLAGTGNLLSARERELLVTAARSIVLEQAARFLADHLDGDLYYPATSPGVNLVRARSQLALLADLTREADRLEGVVLRYL